MPFIDKEITTSGLIVTISGAGYELGSVAISGSDHLGSVIVSGVDGFNLGAVAISGIGSHLGTVTISGDDYDLGAVEIKDHDSDLRAEVTVAGLQVDLTANPSKVGDSVWADIGAVERRLDCTPLSGLHGYPMIIELEAQLAPTWLYQGNAAITLPALPRKRLMADDWQMVTISGVEEAYFACMRDPGPGILVSGTLVGTSTDHRSIA